MDYDQNHIVTSSVQAWTIISALATLAMAVFSGLLIFVNRALVALQKETKLSADKFQEWERLRASAREEPELTVQGVPRLEIGDQSAASKQAIARITLLVSNPGELLATLAGLSIHHKSVTALAQTEWKWTSLFPMLAFPVTQLSSDPGIAQKLLVTDTLPAPVFAGGLVKVESASIQLSFDDAEALCRDPEVILEMTFRPGNLGERTVRLPPRVVRAVWPNHSNCT